MPHDRTTVRVLKDGYWDHTEIIELPDGTRRVRKRSKSAAAPGPWGVESLRREIRYLASLPPRARPVFPEVLDSWDTEIDSVPEVGYEMRYYASHLDVAELAHRQLLPQLEIDTLQDALTDAVVERLHEPVASGEPFSDHLTAAVREALAALESEAILAPLVQAEHIELNGVRMAGPRTAFERIARETNTLRDLDAAPTVRLHGDLFLENILWRPTDVPNDGAPRLILVDPVSVAGVSAGPALFDLVKYISYATGELLALRSEWVEVQGFEHESSKDPRLPLGFTYRIPWDHPGLQPFRAHDWCTRFRQAFEAKHGPAAANMTRLIDAYFSIAMAVNTAGIQQQARLLKATTDFNAVLRNS